MMFLLCWKLSSLQCFARAREELANHLKIVENFQTSSRVDEKCLLQAPLCGEEPCEDEIKEMSKKDADLEPGAPSWAPSLCVSRSRSQPRSRRDTVRSHWLYKQTPVLYAFGRSY